MPNTYTQSGYYLASVADKIAVNPQGSLDIHGLASQMPVFYKDALEKLRNWSASVQSRNIQIGRRTPLHSTEMSEANRQQTTSSLNDIWSFMRSDLCHSRHLSIDEVDSVANQFPLLKETAYLSKQKPCGYRTIWDRNEKLFTYAPPISIRKTKFRRHGSGYEIGTPSE